MRVRGSYVLVFTGCILAAIISLSIHSAVAQPRITDTPVSVVLPTSSAATSEATVVVADVTQTPDLPEVYLQANAPLDQIDVRDFPETGNYLGALEAGRQYRILGQYYSWLLFEYPSGPNGKAWIYRPIVAISGDQESIPIVDPLVANLSVDQLAGTATVSLLQQTPGYAETATAQSREIIISIEETEEVILNEPAATYTPPAEIVPLGEQTVEQENQAAQISLNLLNSIPPIVPILMLLIGGSLGLLSARMRK